MRLIAAVRFRALTWARESFGPQDDTLNNGTKFVTLCMLNSKINESSHSVGSSLVAINSSTRFLAAQAVRHPDVEQRMGQQRP